MTESVTAADLQAYIDGQLDTPGRIELERWLQQHPDRAAEVMEGLRLRDEVRLFLGEEQPIPPATVGLARALTRQLGRPSVVRRYRRGLAAAVLIGAGWLAHTEFGLLVEEVAAAHPVPAVAEAAVSSFDAMRLKLAAGQAPEAEVADQTGEPIPVPVLGDGLVRLGAELVPWAGGTAKAVLYRSAEGELVSLFAAEAGSFAVVAPEAAHVRDRTTVFWQTGPFAYALTAGLPDTRLLGIARHAAPRPWAVFDPTPSTEGATHG